jgi:catechol 2,3-dioxygenase-like lactoylglutathione lyase family enzyme
MFAGRARNEAMSANEQSEPEVVALRPVLPAKDFGASLRFYTELGFRARRLGPPLASMHLGQFAFLLQANDDPTAAANLVMHLLVSDVAAWWARIAALGLATRYDVQAPRAPTPEPWGLTVAYIWDPSGVLWHIAEEAPGGGQA